MVVFYVEEYLEPRRKFSSGFVNFSTQFLHVFWYRSNVTRSAQHFYSPSHYKPTGLYVCLKISTKQQLSTRSSRH